MVILSSRNLAVLGQLPSMAIYFMAPSKWGVGTNHWTKSWDDDPSNDSHQTPPGLIFNHWWIPFKRPCETIIYEGCTSGMLTSHLTHVSKKKKLAHCLIAETICWPPGLWLRHSRALVVKIWAVDVQNWHRGTGNRGVWTKYPCFPVPSVDSSEILHQFWLIGW